MSFYRIKNLESYFCSGHGSISSGGGAREFEAQARDSGILKSGGLAKRKQTKKETKEPN